MADEKTKVRETYTIFVAFGMKIAKGMLQQIQPTPESVAKALTTIVNILDDEFQKKGLELTMEIRLHGAQAILTFILEQIQMEVDEEVVKKIVGLAVGEYLNGQVSSGKMSKEELAQLGQSVQQQPQKGMIAGRMQNG